ncbi:MAG TPA: class I SAM-dependent methyltransferase [Gemmatimonadaceae bacterium]|nr:class I SAM-dependent methyltransferase [Gemmatimonadaceae bacterium]
MTDRFTNVYEDRDRARAYAELEFPGTYYLAFRDIPELLAKHVTGTSALDFGCGAGRSSRFLREQGFDVIGVDISEAMLAEAKARDPRGTFLRLTSDDFGPLGARRFDLIFAAFTFDNIPGRERRTRLVAELASRLSAAGRLVILVSSAEIYTHEWLSFSTRDFPENRNATPSELVRIVMLDGPDRRPVEDIFWTDADYREMFASAGLELLEVHRPLGNDADPFQWVSERDVSPWAIYVTETPRRDA